MLSHQSFLKGRFSKEFHTWLSATFLRQTITSVFLIIVQNFLGSLRAAALFRLSRRQTKRTNNLKKIKRIQSDLGIIEKLRGALSYYNPLYAHVPVRIRGWQYVNVRSFALGSF